MLNLYFLKIEEVITIHQKMLDIGGGMAGIRDIELLHSAIERPKASFSGEYLYPTTLLKGASLLESLTKNHPFIDGNKRTAFFSTLRFYNQNGVKFDFSRNDLVNLMVNVASDKYELREIANWFEENIKD